MEKYIDKITHIIMFILYSGEFYVSRVQAKFCRNCLHHIKRWANLLCVAYIYQQMHLQYVKYYSLFVLIW